MPRRLRFHRVRLANLSRDAQKLVRKWEGRYQLHERLLLDFYSRRAATSWFADPLSSWRTWWRTLGILLLIFNGVAAGASAWVTYRCDADPLCDLSRRRCPSMWEAAGVPNVMMQLIADESAAHKSDGHLEKGHLTFGCRRDLFAEGSSAAVRAFSLVEIATNVRTAYSAVGAAARTHVEGASSRVGSRSALLPFHAYGTLEGPAARVLLALDVLMLVSPWRVRPVLPSLRASSSDGTSDAGWAAETTGACGSWLKASPSLDGWCTEAHRSISGWLAWAPLAAAQQPAASGEKQRSNEKQRSGSGQVSESGDWWKDVQVGINEWSKDVVNGARRAWRDNHLVRTVDGWRRLKELAPQIAPIQYLIDRTIENMWPTLDKKIQILPTIGDLLLEGELLQAFTANFLSSAKVLGLVLSAIKAARVRRGARALRREHAARKIVLLLRRQLANRKVNKLRHKNAWWTVLQDSLQREGSTAWLEQLGRDGIGRSDSLQSLPSDMVPSPLRDAVDTHGPPPPSPSALPRSLQARSQARSQDDRGDDGKKNGGMNIQRMDLKSSPAALCDLRHREPRVLE